MLLDEDRDEDAFGKGHADEERSFRMRGVVHDDGERVGKGRDRLLEGDAVLLSVRASFRRISDIAHGFKCITLFG